MIHISRLLGSTESAVIQQCYVAAKTKAFLCLNLRNHTHHLSFLCKLPAHTHTHLHTLSTLSQKFHSSSNLSAGRGGAVGGQGSRQDTHTSARTANTVKNKYSPLTDL